MDHCTEIGIDNGASREYGVNRKSILTELKYLNICSGALIPDVMHDMLEGLLQYEAKLVMKHIIDCHYMRLSHLNHLIESFELGYMEITSRPSPIILNMDDRTLRQNGELL